MPKNNTACICRSKVTNLFKQTRIISVIFKKSVVDNGEAQTSVHSLRRTDRCVRKRAKLNWSGARAQARYPMRHTDCRTCPIPAFDAQHSSQCRCAAVALCSLLRSNDKRTSCCTVPCCAILFPLTIPRSEPFPSSSHHQSLGAAVCFPTFLPLYPWCCLL